MNEELRATRKVSAEATTREELELANARLCEEVARLEHAHDGLQEFLASTRIAALHLDAELRIRRLTPAARDLLDGGAGDRGRPIGELGCELLQHELEVEVRAVLARRSASSREVGTSKGQWYRREVLPYPAAGDRVDGVVVTFVDVTELRSADEARRRMDDVLRDSEARFRTLADNIAQLAWMADGDGSVVWYNQRWYDYTGTTFDEVKGWGWRRAHHPEHVERVTAKVSSCFRTGEVWEDTFPLRRADGHYRWFLSRAIPIRDEDGRVIRWFGTNTDVTDQREAERRLVQAGRQKDEFIAMLGHELRNPLAAIRSAAELLKLDAQGDDRLLLTQQVIERQSMHMAKLLDGLLDVSRIIRGKIQIEREPVDLAAICRDAAADVAQRIAKPALALRADVPSDPVWVAGDRVRLAQIVDNLLSNAVKFTGAEGTVEIALRHADAAAELTIKDSGIGIEAELLPDIFQAFRQSEQSFDRSTGGLGLGLALVKSLVELHGGCVTADSAGRGRGAEFAVRIPLTSARPTGGGEPVDRASRPFHVLVVEDNADVAAMLRRVLVRAGFEVSVGADGREGVEMARRNPPHVVLCDLGLPAGMSGFDVARELRADPRTADLRLVALTGYGRPEDKQRCSEAGFDAHVTKPVDNAVLKQMLTALAARPR
jgi:PAS domain S-box-containing protein